MFMQDLDRESSQKKIVLHGENDMVTALDTIILTPKSDTLTDVHYRLELSFKGWMRPFVFLIANDLEKLGVDAMDGLTRTCREIHEDWERNRSNGP
jgi:hypothetical protein